MKPIALITGGQQGIGFGIARALVEANFTVALSSEASDGCESVIQALETLGAQARYYQHDLRNISGVSQLLDQIAIELGPVCTLVSNAGIPARIRGDMLALSPENFDAVFDVNLRGAYFLAQEAARRMLDLPPDPYRSIVFVTSVSAALVSIERAEYCISKAAAAMMASLFAARLAPQGIGVFDVRPGIIETGMTEGIKESYSERIDNGLIPAGRWGQALDVGKAVLPLVRGDMAYAPGAVIPVDGGLSITRL